MTEKQKSDFYKNVRCAMIDAGIGFSAVQALCNDIRERNGKKRVSTRFINMMMSGVKRPSDELFEAMEQLCGVSREELTRAR